MTESGEKRWQVNERPERPDSLWLPSRRGMVVGASGVAMAATLAACGGGSAPAPSGEGSDSAAAGTPQKGGDFRLGVTGGGSKDMMDGQNIVTKPDQARLVTAFETLLDVRRQLPAADRRVWPRASRRTTPSSTRSSCVTASRSRTASP